MVGVLVYLGGALAKWLLIAYLGTEPLKKSQNAEKWVVFTEANHIERGVEMMWLNILSIF